MNTEDESAEVEVEVQGKIWKGHPSAIKEFAEHMKRLKAAEQEREKHFPGDRRSQMIALCRLFPSLAEEAAGIDPWNVDKFLLGTISRGGGSGLHHAVRFVLNVWNSRTDWVEFVTKEAQRREQPEDPRDRVLWEGLQQLRRGVRKGLVDDMEYGVKEHGEQRREISDGEVEQCLLGYFKVLGPFNVNDAFSTWDEAHRNAFRTWAQHPFFP